MLIFKIAIGVFLGLLLALVCVSAAGMLWTLERETKANPEAKRHAAQPSDIYKIQQ